MENPIDDLLQNILEVADRPLNLPECKELLKFIEDLKKLDDESFKDKVEGYLQLAEYMEYPDDCIFPNSKAKNAYISKRVIEGMQSLKNQNIKDPVQSIMFLYFVELLD